MWIEKFPSNFWAFACFILQSELPPKQKFDLDLSSFDSIHYHYKIHVYLRLEKYETNE